MGEITPGESIIDAAVQYAQHIPVNVIGRMLGFPEQDEELFRKFVHDVLERIAEEPGSRDGMDDLGKYILTQIAEHRENPRDDLTSYLLNVEIEGTPVDDEIAAGMIVLLLVAGIAALTKGSEWFVDGGVAISAAAGVGEQLIGARFRLSFSQVQALRLAGNNLWNGLRQRNFAGFKRGDAFGLLIQAPLFLAQAVAPHLELSGVRVDKADCAVPIGDGVAEFDPVVRVQIAVRLDLVGSTDDAADLNLAVRQLLDAAPRGRSRRADCDRQHPGRVPQGHRLNGDADASGKQDDR